MDEKYYCLKNYLNTNISTNPLFFDGEKSLPKLANDAPISLAYNDHNGRFMISSRDINKGEVIFWENPVILAPRCGTGPSCLDCFLLFSEDDWPRCKQCGLPRCFPVCDGIHHTQEECRLLASLSLTDKEDANIVKQINIALTPLRSWFENQINNGIFHSLESNVDKRNSSPIGTFIEKYTVQFIKDKFYALNISDDFVRMICGVFDTNAFEVSISSKKARALLPAAALMNHSCDPNSQHWFHNGQCVVRASVHIKKGEPITNNYTQTLWDTKTRRRHLLATKYFWCHCHRCEDAYEIGTYLGCLSCKKCTTGILLQFSDTELKCLHCNDKISCKQVTSWIDVASSIAANVGAMDADSLLRAIKSFECSLGRHHYISLQLQISYVKIIASGTSDNMENLLRVILMCQYILTVLEKITPGYTRLRGLVLLYKSKVFAETLLRLKEKSNIDDYPELRHLIDHNFEEFVEDAAECVKILKYDFEAQASLKVWEQIKINRNVHIPQDA